MKKILACFALLLFGIIAYSQGLEGLIVEKYYEANAADAAEFGMPQGTAIYRFYIDMEPGWELNDVKGNANHELFIETYTPAGRFWNSSFAASVYKGEGIAFNPALAGVPGYYGIFLDSWITFGAATSEKLGVLKPEDNDGSILTGQFNTTALDVEDGLITGTLSAITVLGIDPSATGQFAASGLSTGNRFATSTGAWNILGGIQGPDPAENKLLIAQVATTDGNLNYEFMVTLNDPFGALVPFVASNPQTGENVFPGLAGTTFAPNQAPVVSNFISSPVPPVTVEIGQSVTFDVEASDPGGSGFMNPGGISVVRLLKGGSPEADFNHVVDENYTVTWMATVTGTFSFQAEAEDDELAKTLSSNTIQVTVIPQNQAPQVIINTPSNGDMVERNAVVPINATVSDDSDVDNVEFYINGVLKATLPGTGAGPDDYLYDWADAPKDLGPAILRVVAEDDKGKTTEKSVTVTVFDAAGSPYSLGFDQTVPCDTINTFFVPLIREFDPIEDVIGFDVELNYEPAKITPTGVVTVSGDLGIPRDSTDYAMHVDASNSVIKVSLFLRGVSDQYFEGLGEVLSVEFARNTSFGNDDFTTLQCGTILESYNTGTFAYDSSAAVTYSTYTDNIYVGYLKFWADNSPIDGTTGVSPFFVTNCGFNHPAPASVDVNGMFQYDFMPVGTSNWKKIRIHRQIGDHVLVMPVINGLDAYLAQRVVIDDPSFTPAVQQLIAMDVNLDGVVSAGDVSQINQRTVHELVEFKQVMNYDNEGNKIHTKKSFDWVWVSEEILQTDPGYRISSSWPADDGEGYSKYNVPFVDSCYLLNIQAADGTPWVTGSGECPVSIPESWYGIMLGDVNGNWKNIAKDGQLKSDEVSARVVFDLANARFNGEIFEVPVSVNADFSVVSLDFNLQYNSENLTFENIMKYSQDMTALYNHLDDNNTVLFTSFSLHDYNVSKPVASIRFRTNGSLDSDNLLSEVNAYVNGDEAAATVTKLSAAGINDLNAPAISIYPNPASTQLNVTVSEKATIQLIDISGKVVFMRSNVNADERQEIDVRNLSNGVYIMKIYNGKFTSVEKIILSK